MACIPGVVLRSLWTSTAWFYARLGGSPEAEAILVEYFSAHSALFSCCLVGMVVASSILCKCILKGSTPFPQWAAVFNILTMYIIGGLVKPWVTIPGTASLGGFLMFGGLAALLWHGVVLQPPSHGV